jgi:uncharacterized protein YjbI with pentapeptide repeats
MKVIKPLKQGILYRTFENDSRFYFVVTVFNFFPFTPFGRLHSEIDMWKFAGQELGKEAVLDVGMPKPRGEVIVSGKFFSPDGVPVPAGKVRVRLAGIDKTLYVFGDRYWKMAAGATVGITDPKPMTVVGISYQNAFGGPGFPRNPLGKGMVPAMTETGKDLLPLPNVEDPRSLVTSAKDQPEPAGFAPLDMMWPQRFPKAGTFDQKWFDERFPGLAADLDWTFYNTAPADQQINGFFDGDEPFEIDWMHPQKSHLAARLPAIRSRCFVNHDSQGRLVFKEIRLRPDTVWLFPHEEKGIVIYRGTMEVATDDAEDVKHLLLAYERRADEEKPLDHYQEALSKRLDKEKGYLLAFNEKDLIPLGETSGLSEMQGDDETKLLTGEGLLVKNMKNRGEREKEKINAQLRELGLDPGKYDLSAPPAQQIDLDDMEDLGKLVSEAKERQVQAEEKARKLLSGQGFDYDRLVETAREKPAALPRFSADETIKQLREFGINDPEGEKKLHQTEEMLNKVYREYGHFLPPGPVPHEEVQTRMREAVIAAHRNKESLAGKDFTGVNLENLDLAGVDLKNAFLQGANLSHANLEGADLSGCMLVRANLSATKLASAKMGSAGLGAAVLCGADLTGADLSGAVLARADLSKARLSGAKLDEADFSEANLSATDMTGASLKKSRFMESDLSGAVLAKCDLSEAFFMNASLDKSDFSGATLSATILVGVTANKAVFRSAQCANMRVLNQSSFQEADFANARVTQANLRGTNLAQSNFEGADISESDFSECDLHASNFYHSLARQTQFAKANLANARMAAMNLFAGSLQKADLHDTDLQGANLCMVDFMRVKFRNTNVGQANLAKTSVARWIPK